MRGRLQLLAGTTGSNRGPQKIRKIDNCFPPRKEPLTAVENGQPMGWLTETGLLGDLKIGRRRDVVCQGMRILVRLIDEWWGGIKIISACYKGWISNSSGLNDDMGPVRLCVIPSIRRFVNRSVKGQGRSNKAYPRLIPFDREHATFFGFRMDRLCAKATLEAGQATLYPDVIRVLLPLEL